MPEQIMEIVWNAVGMIVTGLVSYAVTVFTQWISTKIKDAKAANYFSSIVSLVGICVNEISQTYVDSLKNKNAFDEAAQKEALSMCLNKIKTKCAPELIKYITENFGDVDEYLISLIESTIFIAKKS